LENRLQQHCHVKPWFILKVVACVLFAIVNNSVTLVYRLVISALRPPADWRRPVSRWALENYLAEDSNWWWASVLELRGPHGLEEGKR